jgi:hypothetical protein
MLSRGDIAQIKLEIARLEKLYKECPDEGTQKRITAWIEEQKQKLACSNQPPCPVCFNPCRLEECIIGARGRADVCSELNSFSNPLRLFCVEWVDQGGAV